MMLAETIHGQAGGASSNGGYRVIVPQRSGEVVSAEEAERWRMGCSASEDFTAWLHRAASGRDQLLMAGCGPKS